jgi:hypothetical protein
MCYALSAAMRLYIDGNPRPRGAKYRTTPVAQRHPPFGVGFWMRCRRGPSRIRAVSGILPRIQRRGARPKIIRDLAKFIWDEVQGSCEHTFFFGGADLDEVRGGTSNDEEVG